MYGTLNMPTIKALHFSPDSPPGSFWNGGGKVRRGPCAVSFAESSMMTASAVGGSLYKVLRVDPTATFTEIKTAYRSLAKLYHPDLSGDGRGRDFIEIHNAYATLSDPAARAVYDLSLVRRRTRAAASVGYSGGPHFCTTRRWETDQCW